MFPQNLTRPYSENLLNTLLIKLSVFMNLGFNIFFQAYYFNAFVLS
jgi:hypothetical protein